MPAPVWRRLEEARKAGRRVLFEGAQGALLDIDHGTYPYVTSSNTVAGQAAAGSGCGPRDVGFVLGIAKAYTTRVGEGPFPTELNDEIGERIGGRARNSAPSPDASAAAAGSTRCWCARRWRPAGIDGIALTKLDVLDGFEEIKVCTGYTLGGRKLDYLPPDANEQARIEPVYETLPGWRESTRGARSWARAAGERDQVYPPRRGVDRRTRGVALDESRARGHDPGARSVRGSVRR